MSSSSVNQNPPTPYSPVDGNGFSQLRAQHQQSQQPSEPEEFYRPGSQPRVNTMNTELVPGMDHISPVSPNSPADSQAPIMASTREQQLQYDVVGTAQEFPPPPLPSAEPRYRMSVPPPPTVQEYSEYPNTAQTVYAPVNGGYSTSTGAVNGEVGAVPGPTPRTSRMVMADGGYAVPMTPLTPAMKTPTFKEEPGLSKYDEKVQKYDKMDLAVKLKIRLAKIFLRSINCACSLVVLSLLASTFSIFNATKALPPRNNLPPWAASTPQWPQISVLCIACVSLLISLYIMYAYWRGGHNRAEKAAVYSTVFAVGTFIFSIVIWAIAAGIMQGSRNSFNGKDLWGWSCKDNTRKKLFQNNVNYRLVCRQQDWVLVCSIIEILVECVSIAIYAFAFYRLTSKRRLRKSMDIRDKARNELWLAKLREQQAEEATAATNDPETNANTAYNKLTSTTSPQDLEEGRVVPMLMKPPPGHYATALHKAPEGNQQPGVYEPPLRSPALALGVVPPTPRSVSFQAPPPPSSRGSK
ncbi:hypothetical protein L873DRAFT_1714646 [Choiromyces venosus 120613-1]|uniref:MARVEL domain-containing protein n=1 Tax=Choiromyces venosus 120613-1 TaxID=1336337 RepID=A0A3N4IYR3_9PEZI|nr:hypothetical protein L873DRAFT_1714646 [Choiromyces venosus 120613-1]